jgi:hypothetical protein
MKNKLLITSALAGSLLAGGSALAQTSITGDLAIVYSANSKDQSAGAGSTRGFGRESQLNLSNKGKLNNGLDYAASFSLEFDGRGLGNTRATETPSISNENVAIHIINGSTQFSVGADMMQRGYGGAIPGVLNSIEVMRAAGSSVTYVVGAGTSESIGAGITQKVPQVGLTASALYVPRTKDTGSEDIAAVSSFGSVNSSYELTLVGADAFGIKGLGLIYSYNEMEKDQSTYAGDVKGTTMGISYNAGQFAVGADRFVNKNAVTTSDATNESGNATTGREHETTRFGVTFNATPTITLGLATASTDSTGQTTTGKEKVNTIQVGYNLGPVAVQASVAKYENLMSATGPTSDDDGKLAQIRLTTKF